LCRLADAVTPERFAQGLRFLMARAGGKPSVHTGQVAGVICSIARHYVGVEQAQLERLDKVRCRATPKASGMTARNRERLRPFDDPQRVRDLLGLPARLLGEVRRAGAPTPRLALELQAAVAIELLIMVPVRIKNLAALRVGAELLRGRRGAMTLALREGDTKNGAPLEAVLPPETVRLIELYLSDYQPLLAAQPSAWLFPARDGQGPKTEGALRERIQRCIRERCGLAMHPHLFRHLAGKLTLDAQPGAYGQVRDILGHKSVNTTTLYYAGMEAKGALRRYDEHVLRLRDGAASPPRGARRRRA
jgi:integrase